MFLGAWAEPLTQSRLSVGQQVDVLARFATRISMKDDEETAAGALRRYMEEIHQGLDMKGLALRILNPQSEGGLM